VKLIPAKSQTTNFDLKRRPPASEGCV